MEMLEKGKTEKERTEENNELKQKIWGVWIT